MCQQAREREKEAERMRRRRKRRMKEQKMCVEEGGRPPAPVQKWENHYSVNHPSTSRGGGGEEWRDGWRHIISIKHTEGGGLKMATGKKKGKKKPTGNDWRRSARPLSVQGSWPRSSEHRAQMWGKLPPPPSTGEARKCVSVCECVCEGDGGGRLAQGCVEASAPDLPTSFFVKYPPESERTQSHCCSTDEQWQSHSAQ